MNFLIPDWAPNIHPLIVHFPIVLLITAIGFNFLSLIFRQSVWIRKTATILYVSGTLGALALAAFISGRQAVSSVILPLFANPVLNEHADLAQVTLIHYSVISILFIVFWWRSFRVNTWIYLVSFGAAAGGLFLIFETSEYGAELVYNYGVGVNINQAESQSTASTDPDVSEPSLVINEDGSWYINPKEGISNLIANFFTWLEGNPDDVVFTEIQNQESDWILKIENHGGPILITAGDPLVSIQVEATVNPDNFKGSFMLVHHVQDKLNYDFLALETGQMILGRLVNGKRKIYQQKPVSDTGWMNLRVVGDGKHFRGYLNEKLIAHGHDTEFPLGRAGLQIENEGQILIKEFRAVSLVK